MAKSAKETKVTKKPDENEASSKPVKIICEIQEERG
jgi:hypothetical protein